MSKISAFLAEGMEEVECLAVVDIARRAGIEVEMVSVSGGRAVTGSHGITVLADVTFEDATFDESDVLFLPGGLPGVTNLAAHEGLRALLPRFAAQGKRLAALCAGPSVLGGLGLLRGRTATCYPGWEERLEGAHYTPQGVVTDGNVTTARGLGFAIDMGLELVRLLKDEEKAAEIKRAIQHPAC